MCMCACVCAFVCALLIQQIKFFTAEAGLFVRNLQFFSKIENVLISQQLVDLLRDAVGNINTLIENANVIETPTEKRGVIDLIFGFDEHEFYFRRYLECRSCGVSKKSLRLCSSFTSFSTHRLTIKTEWVLRSAKNWWIISMFRSWLHCRRRNLMRTPKNTNWESQMRRIVSFCRRFLSKLTIQAKRLHTM